MRLGLLFGLAYFAAVVASREWRAVVRHTVFRTPWRQMARNMFEAFPSSHWRGAARVVGVPFAAYFAAVVVTGFALVLIAMEILFTPRAVYCSLVRLSRRCRAWFTPSPHDTPPHAAALAMPRPEPRSKTDAVARFRIRH